MEAPKCRVCHERHWSRVCPVVVAHVPVASPVRTPKTEPAKIIKFDRIAYQREYMRRWRASRRKPRE